jgi:hypothetical protein
MDEFAGETNAIGYVRTILGKFCKLIVVQLDAKDAITGRSAITYMVQVIRVHWRDCGIAPRSLPPPQLRVVKPLTGVAGQRGRRQSFAEKPTAGPRICADYVRGLWSHMCGVEAFTAMANPPESCLLFGVRVKGIIRMST